MGQDRGLELAGCLMGVRVRGEWDVRNEEPGWEGSESRNMS